MTLIVENVKQEFLQEFQALAKKTQANLKIQQTQINDFTQLREYMLQDLKKPKNRVVFERLKDQ